VHVVFVCVLVNGLLQELDVRVVGLSQLLTSQADQLALMGTTARAGIGVLVVIVSAAFAKEKERERGRGMNSSN
jgi:hypothetical protein